MNKNDYKALLISIIAGIVAGLAVNMGFGEQWNRKCT